MVQKVRDLVGPLSGRKLGVLGLSFKPNTNDIRESPSIRIIRALLGEGARIRAYDPVAMPETERLLLSIEFGTDAYDAARDCDALVLATEWNQFRNLDLPRLRAMMKAPVFIDLRNVYEREEMQRLGFRYGAVGR